MKLKSNHLPFLFRNVVNVRIYFNISGAPNDKPLERRAHCCAQLEEKYEQAIEDYESLQKMYPERRSDYVKKIADLKRAIDERNERMKKVCNFTIERSGREFQDFRNV